MGIICRRPPTASWGAPVAWAKAGLMNIQDVSSGRLRRACRWAARFWVQGYIAPKITIATEALGESRPPLFAVPPCQALPCPFSFKGLRSGAMPKDLSNDEFA